MPTPYDHKILLVNWLGRTTPGRTPAETAALFRAKMPNVAGIMLKTSNGINWQGQLTDVDVKAVTGVRRVEQWVEAFRAVGLEVHVWGVPRLKRAEDLPHEIDRFASAANVAGVKSLLFDVEHDGPTVPADQRRYWQGTPAQAQQLLEGIRQSLPANFHLGLILDGRKNRPFSFWVEPWLPFVDSLHPMIYPILFGSHKTIDGHLAEGFANLTVYNKPIVPMLQCFGEAGVRPTPAQVTEQAQVAFQRGAAGVSFFRLGIDAWGGDGQPHMGEPEYQALAAIQLPGAQSPVTYTWQDVINASSIVALARQGDWQNDWWVKAGAWTTWNNALRNQPYSGPAVAQWPIDPAARADILHELETPGLALVQRAREAQAAFQRLQDEAAARRRLQKGTLVGIHGAPGIAAPPPHQWEAWLALLKDMRIHWYKQCDNGDPNDTQVLEWCKRLQAAGITPIIRYLQPQQFPDPLPAPFFAKMRLYAAAGLPWAEIGNEPNLDHEWQSEWRNTPSEVRMSHALPEVIRHVAEAWVADAQLAVQAGVKPAFYAFAPTDWRGGSHPHYSSVFFTQKVVAYLAQHHRAAVLQLFNEQGAWIAVHAATYEQPLDFDPFAQPGGVVWDMTLRSYEVVLKAFEQSFGSALNLKSIPVLSTEGGVFTPDSNSMSGHDRLHSNEEHAERTVAMFKWLEAHSPLQAMCPWCLSVGEAIGHFAEEFQFDGWVEQINGQLSPRPVVAAMKGLRFDQQREEERVQPPPVGHRLKVPYRSQWDDPRFALAGLTAVAMVLQANAAQLVTVETLVQRYGQPATAADFETLRRMLQGEGVLAQWETAPDQTAALTQLHTTLDQNRPAIVLVNYAAWDDVAKNNYQGPQFVVVTGYDAANIFVHDPLFRGSRRAEGAHFVWKNARFLNGWGTATPAFGMLVPQKNLLRE